MRHTVEVTLSVETSHFHRSKRISSDRDTAGQKRLALNTTIEHKPFTIESVEKVRVARGIYIKNTFLYHPVPSPAVAFNYYALVNISGELRRRPIERTSSRRRAFSNYLY